MHKDRSQAPIQELGPQAEALEHGPEDSGSSPSQSAAAGAGPAPPAPSGRLSSADAWTSLGLALALAGLSGHWAAGPASLIHGLLGAWIVWHLLRGGFAAVFPARLAVPPGLSGLIVLYGGGRLVAALLGISPLEGFLGWRVLGAGENTLLGVSGALITLAGGLLVLAAPTLGRKKDSGWKAPPAMALDTQFSQSFFAYLLILAGLRMPWGSGGTTGSEPLFGLITLICVLLTGWASWVGMWKLWPSRVVTGKLGLLLFLTPLEALFLGLLGVARVLVPNDFLTGLWPSVAGGSGGPLAFLSGPLLVLGGSGYTLWILYHGTMAAMKEQKARRAEEQAARKAAREARKKGGGDSEANPAAPAPGK
ncbi:MAG: hypothetical protein ACE5H3_07000 [Planctomycetota bacterium]